MSCNNCQTCPSSANLIAKGVTDVSEVPLKDELALMVWGSPLIMIKQGCLTLGV